jgi:type II secretory pathway predicted ATPase ExeA
MDIVHAGLNQQPFHTSGRPVAIIQYQSEQAAHDFLDMVAISNRSIGLLNGPESSGKRTIIGQFVRSMPADIPVAIIDGTRLDAKAILDAIRSQFAYEAASGSLDNSLNELKKFIAQQARHIRQPLLIVENINKMYLSALLILCILAEFKLQGRYAIRMVLVSNKPSFNITHVPAMSALAVRARRPFELEPMMPRETTRYLYAKLRVSGCASPDSVLPGDICDELHKVSRGWPGILDKVVMRAIERAEYWPIRREHIYPPTVQVKPASPSDISVVKESSGPEIQKLYLTLNRETLQEFELRDSKILIGRSELCDLTINSRFVSKYHALIVRTDNVMHLLDLKSTNGTFVNSHRVESEVLRHDDIISLGNHGIKLVSRTYRRRAATEEQDLADTAKMKTLSDMRRPRAHASAGIASIEKREG